MAQKFEFGLDTFGDVTIAPDGKPLTHAQVIRTLMRFVSRRLLIAFMFLSVRCGIFLFGPRWV